MLRRVAITFILLALVGCSRATVSPHPPAPTISEHPSDLRPDLSVSWTNDLTRDQVLDGLDRLMNTGDGQPAAKLERLFRNAPPSRTGITPWVEADLDGDGSPEYALFLPFHEPGTPDNKRGRLVVIYQRDGRYKADMADRMSDDMENVLMAPELCCVADLMGAGHSEIIWTRRFQVNTGPQPLHIFVTSWKPGAFTTVSAAGISSTSGDMPTVSVQGKDLLLTGGTPGTMFLPTQLLRYRFVDGVFRLVDRRFLDSGEDAYSRLWDALVAEDMGRIADAEQAYRAAMDPGRQVHRGVVLRYHAPPIELTDGEVASFGEALRALARFRLGALLVSTGRQTEAVSLLKQVTGPYQGLTKALLQAEKRNDGCQAAITWAAADPKFMPALNRGVADTPWTPQMLCSHPFIG